MPAPLRTLMTVLWMSCTAGAAVIVALSLGYDSWIAFAVSAVVGAVIGLPAGLWTAREIKRLDPNWPPRRRPDSRGVG